MAAASAGRVRNVHTLAEAYCNLIAACTSAGDWERATEWCELVDEFARDSTRRRSTARAARSTPTSWSRGAGGRRRSARSRARSTRTPATCPRWARRRWRRWPSCACARAGCRRPSSCSSGARSTRVAARARATAYRPGPAAGRGCAARARAARGRGRRDADRPAARAPRRRTPRRRRAGRGGGRGAGSLSSRGARASPSSPRAPSSPPLASPSPAGASMPPARPPAGARRVRAARDALRDRRRHGSSSRGRSRPRHRSSRATRRGPPSRPSGSSAPAGPWTPRRRCCASSGRRRGPTARRRGADRARAGGARACSGAGCRTRRSRQTLVISEKTAGHHVSRILSKLGVRNRAEAAAVAGRASGREMGANRESSRCASSRTAARWRKRHEEENMSVQTADSELKARHRAMWGSGDYPLMVETFLLPVGERLVEACGIGPGSACSTSRPGRATRRSRPPARRRGHGERPDPELLEAGRRARGGRGLDLDWVEADAENLPFADESFDVVMSCDRRMFAPHHQAAADELVRVCRPGGTIALLSWTPEGMIGALFATMKPFAPPPRPACSRRRSGAARTTSAGWSAGASSSGRSSGTCWRSPRSRGPRLRRALQGLLRPDDRSPGQRRARGTGATSSTPRSTPSATSGTAAPERGALREGVPARRRHAALDGRSVAAVGTGRSYRRWTDFCSQRAALRNAAATTRRASR